MVSPMRVYCCMRHYNTVSMYKNVTNAHNHSSGNLHTPNKSTHSYFVTLALSRKDQLPITSEKYMSILFHCMCASGCISSVSNVAAGADREHGWLSPSQPHPPLPPNTPTQGEAMEGGCIQHSSTNSETQSLNLHIFCLCIYNVHRSGKPSRGIVCQ